jgi:hypothetical protein
MEKTKTTLTKLLFWATVAGNSIFILWILYNGINEGFKGTIVEKFSFAALITLLAINIYLLLNSRKGRNTSQIKHPQKESGSHVSASRKSK